MIKDVSKNKILLFLTMILSLITLSIFVLLKGPIPLNLGDPLTIDVLKEIRIPKVLTAILAGASLATSGLLMQTFFQNPLAGPFVLGIQSGSSLGVALWVLGLKWLPWSAIEKYPIFERLGLTFSSMLGCLSVLLLLMFLSFRISGKLILLILGLVFSYISSGLINIMSLLAKANELKSFFLWSQGSFHRVSFDDLSIFMSISIIGLLLSLLLSKPLNIMLLGDRYAQSSGVSIRKIKFLLIFLTAILSGLVTSFCGPVAFLGVLVPHLARKIFQTGDHKVLLPSVMILGSIIALFSEALSSLTDPISLPLNAILGVMGFPALIIFLLKNKKQQEEDL
tara:strand:- start:488 stop:1501 length:1014 start_codon:yes stop_codon:yes gene_type:complete